MDELYVKKYYLNEWIAKYFPNQDLISIEELIGVIEDLDGELEQVKQDFEEYKNYIADNYKQITPQEQCDMHDNDFH